MLCIYDSTDWEFVNPLFMAPDLKSADYFIRGRKNGFETDSLLEIINSMEKRPREGAIRILREYADVVHKLQEKTEKKKK